MRWEGRTKYRTRGIGRRGHTRGDLGGAQRDPGVGLKEPRSNNAIIEGKGEQSIYS